MKIHDMRTKVDRLDMRPWIAYRELSDGKRLFVSNFSFAIQDKPTLEWRPLDQQEYITRFKDADAAVAFFKLLDRAGYPVDGIALSPVDICEKCGRIRVSPYQTPPKGQVICPNCRKAGQKSLGMIQ